MAVGAIYRAELAANLKKDLGVKVHRRKNAFAIEGIEDQWRDVFSKRHQQIKDRAKELGIIGDYKSEKRVALQTRGNKKKSVTIFYLVFGRVA